MYSIFKRNISTNNTISFRKKYLSPVLNLFQAYDTPLILEKGRGVY